MLVYIAKTKQDKNVSQVTLRTTISYKLSSPYLRHLKENLIQQQKVWFRLLLLFSLRACDPLPYQRFSLNRFSLQFLI